MTTVQIDLPDALAAQAARAGLFEAEKAELIFRERLRAEAVSRWEAIRALQDADPLPPLSNEEIDAEIAAARAEHRVATGS